jgi:hypothetical protein
MLTIWHLLVIYMLNQMAVRLSVSMIMGILGIVLWTCTLGIFLVQCHVLAQSNSFTMFLLLNVSYPETAAASFDSLFTEIDAAFELCAGAGTAEYGSLSAASRLAIGRVGEQFAVHVLRNVLSFSQVVWLNETEESGLPYDLMGIAPSEAADRI